MIKLKKVVRELRLVEYQPEYDGQSLYVWLNPPSAQMDAYFTRLDRFQALRNEHKGLPETEVARKLEIEQEIKKLDDAAVAWMAELWNQGPEDTHMSLEELKAFARECIEIEPRLWGWMQQKTLAMIFEYRAAEKKS